MSKCITKRSFLAYKETFLRSSGREKKFALSSSYNPSKQMSISFMLIVIIHTQTDSFSINTEMKKL